MINRFNYSESTHDEILNEIEFELERSIECCNDNTFGPWLAIGSIFRSHKPVMVPDGANSSGEVWFREECSCKSPTYPCELIQQITKELDHDPR